jgi:drug/metabolite transporter (DMT)-like permease
MEFRMRRIGIIKKNQMNYPMGAILLAVLAAALYGISAPVSKLLLVELPPTLMAALLYLGAGFGMLLVDMIKKVGQKEEPEAGIVRKDMPYIIGMIVLDIGAPIFLMLGLSMTTSANVALLNNFEIVATSLIALFVFKEAVGKRMWQSIALITLASLVLTMEDHSFSFSTGSVFVLFACICWGFENNCTRMLSLRNPFQIVVIKGFGSGVGALALSLVSGQYSRNVNYIFYTLLLGFVAYGLSIYFYIKAQRVLGAARTSAYYAAAPFIGVLISWLIFREAITGKFMVALAIMLLGAYLAITEVHNHMHVHAAVTHEHKHNHGDGHHNHEHIPEFLGEHSHIHTHDGIAHNHEHTPDIHHTHDHK